MILKLSWYSPWLHLIFTRVVKLTGFTLEETEVQWGPHSLLPAAIRTLHLASLGIWDYGDNTSSQLLSADQVRGQF